MSRFKRLADNDSERGISISDPNVASQIFGISSDSVNVNAQTAMMHTTVYACVNVKAQGLSSVPFVLYEETDNGREKAKSHPLFNILGRQANPLMTSVTWREMMVKDIELNGTHFTQIVRDRGGRIVARSVRAGYEVEPPDCAHTPTGSVSILRRPLQPSSVSCQWQTVSSP